MTVLSDLAVCLWKGVNEGAGFSVHVSFRYMYSAEKVKYLEHNIFSKQCQTITSIR
jgi:hypothetical protein